MERLRNVSLSVTDVGDRLSVYVRADAPCDDHDHHIITKHVELPGITAHDFWAWAAVAVHQAAQTVCPCEAVMETDGDWIAVEEGPGCER